MEEQVRDVVIGTAEASDVEQLAAVHVQGWREAYGAILPERFYDAEALERRRRMWAHVLAQPDRDDRLRVARHGGRVIGFALRGPAMEDEEYPRRRPEQLYALYVLSQWYGRGVGQALLDACLGQQQAELWVAKDNGRARRFYEKNGFHFEGEVKTDTDLDGLVEIRMVR